MKFKYTLILFLGMFLVGFSNAAGQDLVLTGDGQSTPEPGACTCDVLKTQLNEIYERIEILEGGADDLASANGGPGPGACDCVLIYEELADIYARLEALETLGIRTSEASVSGDDGPGPDVCDCLVIQDQLDVIFERIEALESPADRFEDMGDGTVRDNRTGLIWLKDASCAELVGYAIADWWTAMDAADALSQGTCGLDDGSSAGAWRLPTKDELQGIGTDPPDIWEYECPVPWTMPEDPFTGVQVGYYWSSTEIDSSYAWLVRMYNGYTLDHNKDYPRFVWPVRSDN